jgi:hypothetical protein
MRERARTSLFRRSTGLALLPFSYGQYEQQAVRVVRSSGCRLDPRAAEF